MTLTRRPGVPPRKPTDQAAVSAAGITFAPEAIAHFQALARMQIPIEVIVDQITRRREGRTEFVDIALENMDVLAPAQTIGSDLEADLAELEIAMGGGTSNTIPHSSARKTGGRS